MTSLVRRLLDRRAAPDHWDGHLASSALSTATAVLALHTSAQHGYRADDRLAPAVTAGSTWLLQHQNADGGWGDTVRSRSNISTTAIVWATLSKLAGAGTSVGNDRGVAESAIERSGAWLQQRGRRHHARSAARRHPSPLRQGPHVLGARS